jgi:hypothetical protein
MTCRSRLSEGSLTFASVVLQISSNFCKTVTVTQ